MVRPFSNLIRRIVQNRYMIRMMALREIKSRYVGSFFGLFWSVIQPIFMVFIYWFIFSLGFKFKPSGEIPFIVWFFCAFVPWTHFNEMLLSTTNSVIEHKSLIKRTLFPSEILPFIHLVSSGINHLVMLAILGVMMVIQDVGFSFYAFQFVYYWMAMTLLMLGLGWLFACINVFLRDMGQLVTVLMQMWFWGTPIFWNIGMFPEKYHWVLQLNPMYYIVQGYRDSFLYHRPFWAEPNLGAYFWGISLFVFLIGAITFRKMKGEFADVI